MTEYLSTLRRYVDTHPPDLVDADSVLNLLHEAYSECNPMADAQIKAGFHELYQPDERGAAGEAGRDHQSGVFPLPGA